jgi:hypothetical protein
MELIASDKLHGTTVYNTTVSRLGQWPIRGDRAPESVAYEAMSPQSSDEPALFLVQEDWPETSQ